MKRQYGETVIGYQGISHGKVVTKVFDNGTTRQQALRELKLLYPAIGQIKPIIVKRIMVDSYEI